MEELSLLMNFDVGHFCFKYYSLKIPKSLSYISPILSHTYLQPNLLNNSWCYLTKYHSLDLAPRMSPM